MKKFRDTYPKNQRQKEFKSIRAKYPNRIPVIIDPEGDLRIDKRKYLVEYDMVFANFIYVVRQKLKVKANESLFFLYEGKIPCQSHTIGQIFNEGPVSSDGFLVLSVARENTFGT